MTEFIELHSDKKIFLHTVKYLAVAHESLNLGCDIETIIYGLLLIFSKSNIKLNLFSRLLIIDNAKHLQYVKLVC